MRIWQIKPTRARVWHSIAMLVLLLGAAALYFTNLDFGLPDFLYGDEGPRWIQVEQLLARGQRFQNPYYPPGWEFTLAGQKVLLDFITPGSLERGIFLYFGRVSSASLGLVTLALVYDTGKRFGVPLAGIIAAAFVAVYPVHVQHAHLIKPDIAANVLGMLALWAALVGLERNDWWFGVSLGAALLAFVTKYTALAAIGVPFLATLVKYAKEPRKLVNVGGPLLLGAIVALGLLHWRINLVKSLLNVRYDFPETTERVGDRASSLEFPGLGNGLGLLYKSLGAPMLTTSLGLLPIVLTVRRSWRAKTTCKLIVVAAYGLAVFGTFAVSSPVYLRYYLPSVVTIALIWGLALAWALPRGFAPLVAIPFAAFLMLPFARKSVDWVQWLGQEDTLAIATNWFVENVPQGTRIAVDGQAEGLYFRRYSGYAGPLIYNATNYGPLIEQNVDALAGGGVQYVVASTRESREHYSQLVGSREMEGLHIAAEIAGEGRRGPHMVIVTLPSAAEQERYLWFGLDQPEQGHETPPFQLRGYDLPRDELQPGFVLTFTLYWMSVWPTGEDYVVQAWLQDPASGKVVAQHGNQPQDGNNPTSGWLGDMQFVADEQRFPLPDDIRPGTYELRVALAHGEHAGRLPISEVDGEPVGDSFALGQIRITE